MVHAISIGALIIPVAHFSRYDAARYTTFLHYLDRMSKWWKTPIAGPLAEKCMSKFKLPIKRCTITITDKVELVERYDA